MVGCGASADGKSSGLGISDRDGPGIVAECVSLGETLSAKSIEGGAADVELLAGDCWPPKRGEDRRLSGGLANGLSG